MKNFLAIDTSGEYLCVAAQINGKEYFAFERDCAMKHSVLLMTKIDEMLKSANADINDFDCFFACVGAGSFTGIRIGIAAAQGFAVATKKACYGVTSFEIAAYNRVKAGEEKTLAIVDAMHGYYYACGYEKGEISISPAYLSEEEVLNFVAQGYQLCATKLPPIAEKAEVALQDPAKSLLGAVKNILEKGEHPKPEALYIRKSSAEENLVKGQEK